MGVTYLLSFIHILNAHTVIGLLVEVYISLITIKNKTIRIKGDKRIISLNNFY